MTRPALRIALLGVGSLLLACGPRTAQDRERQVIRSTEIVEDVDRNFLPVFSKNHQGKAVEHSFEVRIREFGRGLGLLRFEMASAPSEMAWWQIKRLWNASAKAEVNG